MLEQISIEDILQELEQTNINHDFQKFNEDHQLIDRIDTINQSFTSTQRFTVLSLFSGCGGFDLGFKGGFTSLGRTYPQNNFDIIWANEITQHATNTYKENLGDHIICKDINDIENVEFPKADIILGGFPCQDFSLAGKRQGLTVERGRLYLQMKRVIDTVQPKVFIAENVKNLLMMEKGLILKTIIDDFKASGYNVYFHLFHAANYGVPQNRERVIIFGIRQDLDITPFLPLEIYSMKDWITTSEAIDDLWDQVDNPDIPNHKFNDISKAKFYEGKKTQGNSKIFANKIAPTIRAEHHGNIEAHYRTKGDAENMSNWRRLSVRECARIQTFPDDFVFKSAASSAYKQVGNAVPPVLSWHIARALYLSMTL